VSVASLTLDTSCVISLLCLPKDSTPADELDALELLQGWQTDARVEIFISEKSRTEALLNLERARTVDPANRERAEKWLETLNLLDQHKPVTGRWILGVSRLGIDTVLGSEAESDVYEELAQVLFSSSPPQLNEGDLFDLTILFEHYIQQNDLFVTRDKANNMLRKRTVLEANWNILVCSPVEATRLRSTIAT
jgi:hypothetical protein